jgi:hypothetical protein
VKNGSRWRTDSGVLTKTQSAKDIILEVCNEAEAILGKLIYNLLRIRRIGLGKI